MTDDRADASRTRTSFNFDPHTRFEKDGDEYVCATCDERIRTTNGSELHQHLYVSDVESGLNRAKLALELLLDDEETVSDPLARRLMSQSLLLLLRVEAKMVVASEI